MTQVVFTVNEEITASRLNQATQGYKFLRRTTYAGSSGSIVGNAIYFVDTWFPGSGTSALYVRVCGAGGGSYAARGGTPANTSGVSGGAGGGGYYESFLFSGFMPSQQIRIGLGGAEGFPGGQSMFGAFLSASGGQPGGFSWHKNGSVPIFVAGGTGGVGSGSVGNPSASGNSGGIGLIFSLTSVLSGRGGQSGFGGAGGIEVIIGPSAAGIKGSLYGGGGGGAAVVNAPSLINAAGADGAPGFVIVDEYA